MLFPSKLGPVQIQTVHFTDLFVRIIVWRSRGGLSLALARARGGFTDGWFLVPLRQRILPDLAMSSARDHRVLLPSAFPRSVECLTRLAYGLRAEEVGSRRDLAGKGLRRALIDIMRGVARKGRMKRNGDTCKVSISACSHCDPVGTRNTNAPYSAAGALGLRTVLRTQNR